MLKLKKSSGVEAPRNKISFLAPHPLQGFLGVRGCAPGFSSNNESKPDKTKHY